MLSFEEILFFQTDREQHKYVFLFIHVAREYLIKRQKKEDSLFFRRMCILIGATDFKKIGQSFFSGELLF